MFYLRKAEQIRAAETFDRAAALVKQGWELTTRQDYMRIWAEQDAQRLAELTPAPLERAVGE